MNEYKLQGSWIRDREKYGLVGLEVNLDVSVTPEQMTPKLWALSEATFTVPTHWKEWLGSIRAEELEACNLILLSKLPSATPDVLDAENKALQQQAWSFYVGLLLSSTFAPRHRPVLLTGSRNGNDIGIRQQQDIDAPVPCVFRPYPAIRLGDVRRAAQLGENLEALAAAPIPGKHWRLFRTLHIYTTARTTPEIVDRIHQYCRCLDGVIVPQIGKTRQQFKSRTELFIGTAFHDLMGGLYDIRSAAEHLHENKYLEHFDRAARIDLVEKEAIAEHIARSTLAHIVESPLLWPHFANTQSLERFWALSSQERRNIWGDPFDPRSALTGFEAKDLNDGELGA